MNIQFRLTFSKNGNRLGATEWSDDKDAIIELMSAVNGYCRDIRATVETKASGHVELPQAMRIGG